MSPISLTTWIVLGILGWIVVAVLVGLVVGAMLRVREAQIPTASQVPPPTAPVPSPTNSVPPPTAPVPPPAGSPDRGATRQAPGGPSNLLH